MRHVRKVILALALVLTVLVGGIGPMGSVADASHNPTSGCWFEEWTDHNDPSYGPHWGYYPDHGGWWYYQWFIHWENCEDGWGEFIEWHAHWYGPYGY